MLNSALFCSCKPQAAADLEQGKAAAVGFVVQHLLLSLQRPLLNALPD